MASMPRDAELALVGAVQRGDRPDERGLAGAVRAEHGGDLAGRGDEVETVERDDLLVARVARTLGDARTRS